MLAYSRLLFWWLGYLENHPDPQEKPSQHSAELGNKVKLHDLTQQRVVERGMGLELRRKQTRNDSITHGTPQKAHCKIRILNTLPNEGEKPTKWQAGTPLQLKLAVPDKGMTAVTYSDRCSPATQSSLLMLILQEEIFFYYEPFSCSWPFSSPNYCSQMFLEGD